MTAALLQPWAPLAINLIVFAAALFLYDVDVQLGFALLLVPYSMLVATLLVWALTSRQLIALPKRPKLPFGFLLSLIIVGASLLEFSLFGVPLFGDVLYVEFGLPLIHHIAVSSWLLVFVASQARRRPAGWLLHVFAMANPILMLNRDTLLLTLFCQLALAIMQRRIRGRLFWPILAGILALFGVIGELRSPNVIEAIDIPFAVDASALPALALWPLIYITSSAFNMFANFDTLRLELHFPLINVFPEAHVWAASLGSHAVIPIFYFAVGGLLLALRKAASARRMLVPMYVYFVYQGYMAVFSTKFFTTNSLFVLGLFLCLLFGQTVMSRPGPVVASGSVGRRVTI